MPICRKQKYFIDIELQFQICIKKMKQSTSENRADKLLFSGRLKTKLYNLNFKFAGYRDIRIRFIVF